MALASVLDGPLQAKDRNFRADVEANLQQVADAAADVHAAVAG